MKIDELEQQLGYTFDDRSLLVRALTHRSWAEEAVAEQAGHQHHNERLEFLGDMVIGLGVTELLCQSFLTAPEGVLSRTRAKMVGTSCLAVLGAQQGLGEHLRLGRGEEQMGGRTKQRLLANCLEAVAGAVFEDGGYAAAQRLVRQLFAPLVAEARDVGLDHYGVDPKNLLQHRAHARWAVNPRYVINKEEGPAHEPMFTAEVILDDHLRATGEPAPRKQDAGRSAARAALRAMDALTAESGEE